MNQGTGVGWRRLRICLCGVMVLAAQSGLLIGRGIAAPLDIPDGLPAPTALVATPVIQAKPDAATKTRISEAYGKLPLAFNYSSSFKWNQDPNPFTFKELGDLGYRFID